MSHWHFTIAETAFLTPLGVLLGAAVSYLATRKNANDNLTAQQLAIDAARNEADAARSAELDREQRDHRRTAYGELGEHLQTIDELLNYLVEPMLSTSVLPEPEWDGADGPAHLWSVYYAQLRDALPECRRAASVYGSDEIRAAVSAIGMLSRSLAAPARFAEAPGHWIYSLSQQDGGITFAFETVGPGHRVHAVAANNIRIVQMFVTYALAEIRHEQQPHHVVRPDPPPELAITS